MLHWLLSLGLLAIGLPFALTDVMLLEPGVGAAQSSGSGNATDSLGRLINATQATGTALSQLFAVGGMRDGVLTLTSDLGANMTAFKVDLERQTPLGNWVKVQVGIDLFTTQEVRVNISGGGPYRLNVTTYTASAGTPSCSVWGRFEAVSA